MNASRPILLALAAALAGCAAEGPPYGEVVTMKAGEAAGAAGYPPPGTVWRLEEGDLKKLSPAPFVGPPPPPRLPPPPRPNDPQPYYHGPYYEPYLRGPSFHYWGRW